MLEWLIDGFYPQEMVTPPSAEAFNGLLPLQWLS